MFTLFHHPFCPHSRFTGWCWASTASMCIGGGADLGTARGLSCIEPRGHHPVLCGEGLPPIRVAIIAE